MKRQTALLHRIVILAALLVSGCSRSTAAAATANGVSGGMPGGDASAARSVTVDDPAVQMPAFTLTVPQNWKFTGMIARPSGCHGPAVAADGLTYTFLAPDGITASEKLPGVSWAWVSDGSNFANCKPVNIGSALSFLLNIAVPNLRPDARSVTAQPLPADLQQAIGNRNHQLQPKARHRCIRSSTPPSSS